MQHLKISLHHKISSLEMHRNGKYDTDTMCIVILVFIIFSIIFVDIKVNKYIS